MKESYTKIPNFFFNDKLKVLSGNSIKVYLAISRKTVGWHKTEDIISNGQLMKMCNISRVTLLNSINELIKEKLITVNRIGTGKAIKTTYSLYFNTSEINPLEINPLEINTSEINPLNNSNTSETNALVSYPTKETTLEKENKEKEIKKINKEKKPLASFARHIYPDEFLTIWSLYPSRGKAGSNKVGAYAQYKKRLEEGYVHEQMLNGTIAYQIACNETGKTGTEFVKDAKTFFGKDAHFLTILDNQNEVNQNEQRKPTNAYERSESHAKMRKERIAKAIREYEESKNNNRINV